MAPTLPDWLRITEVDDGRFFAAPLFRRKFGGEPPESGHHLVAFYQPAPLTTQTLCYAHFMPFGDILLVGGVCTDGIEHARPKEAYTGPTRGTQSV